MRAATIIGIILILLGVLALVYQGVTYTTEQTLFNLGPVEVESEERQRIPLPPILGALSLIGGVVLVIAGRRK